MFWWLFLFYEVTVKVLVLIAVLLVASPYAAFAEDQSIAKEALITEIVKAYEANPEKTISEIQNYADQENWEMVKLKTELLLNTDSEQIKNLHQKATEILAIEEQENKQRHEEELARLEELQKQKELEEKKRLAKSWAVIRGKSDMDDSKTIYVGKEADYTVDAWLKEVRPLLTARCYENKTSLIMKLGASFDSVYGKYNKVNVEIRLDDDKAYSEHWTESTDGDAIFAPRPIPLLKKLTKARTLKLRLTPFNSTPVVIAFDVRGLESHLPEVASTCGWSL